MDTSSNVGRNLQHAVLPGSRMRGEWRVAGDTVRTNYGASFSNAVPLRQQLPSQRGHVLACAAYLLLPRTAPVPQHLSLPTEKLGCNVRWYQHVLLLF
jgi:hypothetical protein